MELNYRINWTYFIVLIVLACSSQSFGQTQVFANLITLDSNVDNPQNAVSSNNEFATLNSFGGTAIGIGSFTGELELQFPNTLPANTTSYVKLEFDEDILSALLGGSLGELLADTAGTIVLGNHFINVEARMNTTTVLAASSQQAASNFEFRVVKAEDGSFLIAITPDQAYNRIYIEDVTNNLLLGINNESRIFNAFYFENNEFDCEYEPLYTNFDGTGLNVDALGIGGAGVVNAEFAIDDDPTNFSELSLGIASVTSSITQNVYFPDTYSPQEQFAVSIRLDPTLVTLGLLNNIEIKAFNGANEVYSETVSNLINLDLLTLLQNGETATIPFSPNVSFNRVSLTLSALLGANVSQSLDFFGAVALGPIAPTTSLSVQEFCAIDEPTIADIQINENQVVWYEALFGGTELSTDTLLQDSTFYFAAQLIDGCIGTRRLAIQINLNNPESPTTNSQNQVFCFDENATVASLQVNESNVMWFDAPTNGNSLSNDTPLENNETYYAAQVQDGCVGTERLMINVTIENPEAPTTSNTNQEFCESDNPRISDIDVDQSTIWYDSPSEGNELAEDVLLVNGLYYGARITSNNCISEDRLEVTVVINDAATPTTEATNQFFCTNSDPVVGDISVNEQNVIWYDQAQGGQVIPNSDALINGTTYYGSLTEEFCQSSERLPVTVTVGDTSSPTTINNNQEFCEVDNPTVASLSTIEDNVLWYLQEQGGEPLDESASLTTNTFYYAALNGTNCESSQRLEIFVTINDSQAPEVNETTQSFCTVDNATILDIDIQGESVLWYATSTSDSVLSSDTILENGMSYYATQTSDNDCESSTRTEVVIIVDDSNPPTTTNSSQQFCETEDARISDLQTNESNVTWYISNTSTTPLDENESLSNGSTYFATRQGANGCESSERLEVSVMINAVETPIIESSNNSNEACLNSNVTYSTQEGQNNYNWIVANGNIVSGGGSQDNFVEVNWTSSNNNSVSISYDATRECSTGETISQSINVMECGNLSITKTVDNLEAQVGDEITFTVTLENSGPTIYSNIQIEEQIQSGFEVLSFEESQGTYNLNTGIWLIDEMQPGTATLTIVVEVLSTGDYSNTASILSSEPATGDDDTSDDSGSISIIVTNPNDGDNPDDENPDDLDFENLVSPNNDGVNDFFVIENISNFPNNRLSIYNRYGSLIYNKANYDNTWNGTANVNGVAKRGEILPSETYYFVLEISGQSRPLTGWVFIAY